MYCAVPTVCCFHSSMTNLCEDTALTKPFVDQSRTCASEISETDIESRQTWLAMPTHDEAVNNASIERSTTEHRL